ncbi:MAG: winged helix-turn-helix domain-containing protein [Actinomycetota bacterium]|nr:winged helix-turn-helix domain-containing protein [Actinomycetota bacterium]
MGLARLEHLLKAIGYKARLELLSFLLEAREATLQELSEVLEMPFKTVSRNLKVLQRAGFVKSRIEKGRSLYSISRDSIHRWNLILLALIEDAKRKPTFASKTASEVVDDLVTASFEPTFNNFLKALSFKK